MKKQGNEKSNWKHKFHSFLIILYLIAVKCFGIYFAFSWTTRNMLENMLHHTGPLSLIILGGVLVTIGFPMTFFELALAGAIRDFKLCFAIAICTHFLGSSIIYVISKNLIAGLVWELLGKNRIFRTLSHTICESPWKMCFVVKSIMMPLIVKKYALALLTPSFAPYIVSGTIVAGVYSVFWINLGYSIDDMLKGSKDIGELKKGEIYKFKMIMLVFSLIGITYITWYAKKVYSNIEKDVLDEEKPHEEEKIGLANEEFHEEIFENKISSV